MRYPLAALALACLLAGCATGSNPPTESSAAPTSSAYSPLAESTSAVPSTSHPASTSASRTTAAPKPKPTTTHPSISAPAASRTSARAAAATPRPTTSSAAPRTSAATTKAAPRPASSSTPAPKPSSSTTTAAPTTFYTPMVAEKYGTGNATQLITVTSHGASDTTAILSAWKKFKTRGWVKVASFDGLTAHVGSQGVGAADENHSRTPAGSFTLTFTFGNQSNPGTRLPYHHVDSDDIWVGDSNSKYYNTLQSCPSSKISNCGSPSEDLSAIGRLYNYAALIDYNTADSPTGVVPHKGSAFFLHVTDGNPTGGCVALSQDKVIALLKWLDPAQHPRIVIGVV